MNFYSQAHFKLSRIKEGKMVIKMIESLRRFDIDEVAKQTISESTIGNIIKRNNYFYQTARKIYHDPSSKWATRKKTKRLNATNMTNFKVWQSDNGKENLGLFDEKLKQDQIPHLRTLQDDIIDPYLDLIHHSLNLRSPLQYFIDEGGMSQMSLTYTCLGHLAN